MAFPRSRFRRRPYGIEVRTTVLWRGQPPLPLRIGHFQRHRFQPLLAKVIDRGVAGDSKEPGRELVLRIEPGERLIDLEEDLLSQVEGVVALSDHLRDVGVNACLIAANEGSEEIVLSGQHSGDDGFVALRILDLPDLLLQAAAEALPIL
jgi:hypothetical protein